MTEYSKLNIIYKLQKWMDSVSGQTFLNYAYSWGAAIVILGTLFKLTHLPGANFFLYLGMGTEVVVFFLSAFDRPFDKTADGMELQVHADAVPAVASGPAVTSGPTVIGSTGSGTIIVNGGTGGGGVQEIAASAPIGAPVTTPTPVATPAAAAPSVPQFVAPQLPEGMDEAIAGYAEELETLNRTLTGISRVYEMQLKSASTQMGTIDEINEQTRRMAQQIAELNSIYARMIEAMQVRSSS